MQIVMQALPVNNYCDKIAELLFSNYATSHTSLEEEERIQFS